MAQEFDSSCFKADIDLGERLGLVLDDHPDLELQQLLNVASDLMGERDGLLPAFRVLATQPSLMALLRIRGTPAARPQFDAVLDFVRQTLAPQVVARLQHVLAAASGLTLSSEQDSPLPVSLKAASPRPSAIPAAEPGTVMASSSRSGDVSEPGTMMASDLRPAQAAPTTAGMPESSVASGFLPAVLPLFRPAVVAVVVLFGFYGLLRSPLLCESFDLCNTEAETSKPDNQSTAKPAEPVKPTKASRPVAAPTAQRPVAKPPAAGSAPAKPRQGTAPVPESPEPLW